MKLARISALGHRQWFLGDIDLVLFCVILSCEHSEDGEEYEECLRTASLIRCEQTRYVPRKIPPELSAENSGSSVLVDRSGVVHRYQLRGHGCVLKSASVLPRNKGWYRGFLSPVPCGRDFLFCRGRYGNTAL